MLLVFFAALNQSHGPHPPSHFGSFSVLNKSKNDGM